MMRMTSKPQNLSILGVDPGSRITGFGVVHICGGHIEHVSHGVIVMDTNGTFPGRMLELGEAFQEVIQKYRPQHVAVEKIFLGKNADSAFKLGHARGVVMYEAMRGNAQVYEYATRLVKKGITGDGGASKEQVQAVLQSLLRIDKINRLDASDALAMACYHAYELQKERVFRKAIEL